MNKENSFSWGAIFTGWVVLLVGSFVFGLLFGDNETGRTLSVIASLIGAGMATHSLSANRKGLHVVLMIIGYYIVFFAVLAIFAGLSGSL